MCVENFIKALMTRIRKNYDLCFMKWKSHHILSYWNQYKPNSIELIFKWYLISIDRYFIVWNVKNETDSENWVANITRNAFDILTIYIFYYCHINLFSWLKCWFMKRTNETISICIQLMWNFFQICSVYKLRKFHFIKSSTN